MPKEPFGIRKMPKLLKNLLASFGIGHEVTSAIEISRTGAVRVDPNELVKRARVQRQIESLDEAIESGSVRIESPRQEEDARAA